MRKASWLVFALAGCIDFAGAVNDCVGSDTVVVGDFDRFNVIFTTSNQLPVNYALADSSFNARFEAARDAGLGANFRPWSSDNGLPGQFAQLTTSRGWMRPDGMPVADTYAELAAGRFFSGAF